MDSALLLAQRDGWQNINLLAICEHCGCSMVQLRSHFRSKDDIAEALFDRADEYALSCCDEQDFKLLDSEERLQYMIVAWLNFLLPYRNLVKDIIAYKIEPGHVHLQAHAITRISRTVQWFMHAADVQSSNVKRVMDEIAISAIFVCTMTTFMMSKRTSTDRANALLGKLLHRHFNCPLSNRIYKTQQSKTIGLSTSS
ncbi:TetR/AcrR family transcriptional regulator [Thalassotalea maritima]|uniref:TetR/AcrR family transcriptional regulator n=1 Tax=Thalassotalea maritima TaxID=3242416 RepID=UPI0035292432